MKLKKLNDGNGIRRGWRSWAVLGLRAGRIAVSIHRPAVCVFMYTG